MYEEKTLQVKKKQKKLFEYMSRDFYLCKKDLSWWMLWVGSEALGIKPG